MPYIATDNNGWAVRSYTTSGVNAGYVAYVAAAGNDGTGAVHRIGDAAVGTDPHAPSGAIAPFATGYAALEALAVAMGGVRAAQQGLLLWKRGDTFTMTDGIRRSTDPAGSAFTFSGPSLAQPFTLGNYGTTGARPIIKWSSGIWITGRNSDVFGVGLRGGSKHILIDGLDLRAFKRLPGDAGYDPDNTACAALAAATNTTDANTARATGTGVARKDITPGKFNTNDENDIENITVQDTIVRGACAGWQFSRETADANRIAYLFINRVSYDRIYNHHTTFGGRNDGRSNFLYINGSVVGGRVWGIAGRYLGYLPSSEDARGGIMRHNQSQCVYSEDKDVDNIDFRDVVLVQGCLSGLQTRGGNGHTLRGVVMSGHGEALANGHRENDYDREGANAPGPPAVQAAPKYQQAIWEDAVVEAPDALTNEPFSANQGFVVRRTHALTARRFLMHRGSAGTGSGFTSLNVFESGKPNPSTGAIEPVLFEDVVVSDWHRNTGGDGWKIGGQSRPANSLNPDTGALYTSVAAGLPSNVTFRRVKLHEPLATGPVLSSVVASPGASYEGCELFTANRGFVSSFNRLGSEVQRDFDATTLALGGTGWQWREQVFPDTTRDVGAYAVNLDVAVVGDSYTTRRDKLMDACFANHRGSFNAALLGLPMAKWILAGYGLAEIVNPPTPPTLRPVANRPDRASQVIDQLPRGNSLSSLWAHTMRLSNTLGRFFDEPRARSLVQVVQPNAEPSASGLYPATTGRSGSTGWLTGDRKVAITVMGRSGAPLPASTYMVPVLIRGGTVTGIAYPALGVGQAEPWIPTSDTAAGVAGWLIVGKEGRAELTVSAGVGGCNVMAGEPSEVAPSVQVSL